MIYITETHASDGWSFGNAPHEVNHHKCLHDRLEAAKLLREYDIPCTTVVDPMTNETASAYGATPDRLYIVQDELVVYEGGRGPANYHIEEVESWLKKISDTKKNE